MKNQNLSYTFMTNPYFKDILIIVLIIFCCALKLILMYWQTQC